MLCTLNFQTLYQKTASSAAAGTLLAANNGAFAPNLRPCDLDDSAPLDAATCAGYSSSGQVRAQMQISTEFFGRI